LVDEVEEFLLFVCIGVGDHVMFSSYSSWSSSSSSERSLSASSTSACSPSSRESETPYSNERGVEEKERNTEEWVRGGVGVGEGVGEGVD
jgi:hypothetical protein